MREDIPLDPVAAYGRIAPEFARLAAVRRAYLDAVDRIIAAEIPPGGESLLDVGAGDGSRARRIAQSAGLTELVLLEPSAAMRGSAAPGAKVWTLRAEDLHTVEAEFDVITCLWNVLGHIFPSLARTEVLCQLARLITPHGKVFVDVNHRYNARHYGVMPTALRFLRDSLLPGDSNGDVTVAWEVDGARATTTGHVFTDGEFRSMARAAGLTVERRWVLDYATGETRRWSFQGHLLYALTR